MSISEAVKHFYAMVRRRRTLILLVLVLIGGGVSAFIAWQPPYYVASTKLLAKYGREYIYRQEMPGSSSSSSLNYTQDEIVNSVVEILESKEIARATLADFGVDLLFPKLSGQPFEKAVEEMEGRLKITPVRRSNVILVEFWHQDAVLAAKVLTKFVDNFKAKYLLVYGEKRIGLFEDQMRKLDQDLQAAQHRVEHLEKLNRAYAADTQLELLVRDRVELDMQRQRVSACCASSSSAQELNEQIANLDSRIENLQNAKQQLLTATRERDLAREIYDGYRRKMEDVRLSAIMDQLKLTSIEVIDPAVPPQRPAFPSKPVKIAMVMGFSLLLGLGIAWIVDIVTQPDAARVAPGSDFRSISDPRIKGAVFESSHSPLSTPEPALEAAASERLVRRLFDQ